MFGARHAKWHRDWIWAAQQPRGGLPRARHRWLGTGVEAILPTTRRASTARNLRQRRRRAQKDTLRCVSTLLSCSPVERMSRIGELLGGCVSGGSDVLTLFFLQPIMSSKLPSVLSATEDEIQMLLAAQCHIGTKNCDKQMEPYVWKRRSDG